MTRRRFEGDPTEALRRADPLDPLEVPKDTTGAHARALFQEVTNMDVIQQEPAPRPKKPLLRRVALGVAGAVVVAAIAGGAYALLRDEAEERIVGGEPIESGGMASCLMYDEQTLLAQQYAFDGTLIEANADGVHATFEVHRWFKGGEGDQVTLQAEGMLSTGAIALLGLGLEEGQRYLISGTDGFVWACGYSVTYDSDLADHWAELFGA